MITITILKIYITSENKKYILYMCNLNAKFGLHKDERMY